MPRPFRDLTGQVFGRLQVVWPAGIAKDQVMWLCCCEDGNLAITRAANLYRGETRSCGCLHREAIRSRMFRGIPSHESPERRIYWAARERCSNPHNKSYKNYGGRGIQFRFTSFADFWDALGPRPDPSLTIERINNDGHYERGNVCWATRLEQRHNRRDCAA
jgi:hypothetical protein